MTKDSIFIDNLAVKTRIGVYEWEQRIEQKLLISLAIDVGTAFDTAAQTDNVEQTLSYAWLAEALTSRIQKTQHALLETLIVELGEWVTSLDGVEAYRLTIRKPGAVADAESVGVRRAWQRPRNSQ